MEYPDGSGLDEGHPMELPDIALPGNELIMTSLSNQWAAIAAKLPKLRNGDICCITNPTLESPLFGT